MLDAFEAIGTRRSVRGFLDTPVPEADIRRILAVASRAPSATNTQPWRVYVLTGAAQQALSDEILAAHDSHEAAGPEYQYYPLAWRSPYLDRRRKVGFDLYGHMQVARGDKAAMHAAHARNFSFFGAPVGMIFTIDRDMGLGAYLDLGMFMQNIMVAARALGLDTCPQAAFASHHLIIRRRLALPEEAMVMCGMSLGHADPAVPANALETEREPVERFTTFLQE
jgi:nitroreductase